MTMLEMGYMYMEACGMYLENCHKLAVYTYTQTHTHTKERLP
jgi:hypothetical protein